MIATYKYFLSILLLFLLVQPAFGSDLDQRLLTHDQFKEKITVRYSEVLDLRGEIVDELLFPLQRVGISLRDTDKLDEYLNNKTTVLAFDKDGSQLETLQKLLKKKGIRSYYFLKGGVDGVFGHRVSGL